MRRSLTFYFTSEVFLSFGLGIIFYAQPFFYASIGINDKIIGLLFSVSAIAGGIGALFLGAIADRVGVTRMFKVATGLVGVGYLLLALTHTVAMWLTIAVLCGLAGALLMSTENVVLSTLTKSSEKAGIFSKFVAWYMFLIGCGSVASGFLCTEFGYQRAMLIGACMILVAPLLRFFVHGNDTLARSAFRLPHRRIILMSGYAMLVGLATGLLNPFATLILQTNFHVSTHLTALVSALAIFGVSGGSLLVGILLTWFRSGPTLFASFLLSAGMTFGLAIFGGATTFVSFYLLRSIVSAVPGSIVDAAFLERTEKTEFAQMFGYRVFGMNVGTGLGTFTGGSLLSNHHLSWLLICSGITFIIAYVYLAGLFRRLKRIELTTKTHFEQSLLV